MSIDSGLRQAEEITREGEYHFAADSVAEARALLKSQGKAIDALQAKLDAVIAMTDEMSEAVAIDTLTTPQGEAEYPVSYLREKILEAIGESSE